MPTPLIFLSQHFHLDLDKLLESWIYGPKIIVAGKRRDQYGIRDPYKTMSVLKYNSVVVEVDLYTGFWGHDVLPTGTLLNIGLDVTRTDLVCVCPNCVRVELLFGVESNTAKLSPEVGMLQVIRQLSNSVQSETDNSNKETHAVLSVDNEGLKAYKLQRERIRQNNGMLDDINNIKQELIELRGILKQISSKL